jgi:hypothetical protein
MASSRRELVPFTPVAVSLAVEDFVAGEGAEALDEGVAGQVRVAVGLGEFGEEDGGLLDEGGGLGHVLVGVMGPVVAGGVEGWALDQVERVTQERDGLRR